MNRDQKIQALKAFMRGWKPTTNVEPPVVWVQQENGLYFADGIYATEEEISKMDEKYFGKRDKVFIVLPDEHI